MELIMLFGALFVFCFGSLLISEVIEYGIRVSDKALQSPARLLKLVSISVKKLTNMLKSRESDVQLRTIYVTPVELQHMRNNQLFQSKRRSPVQIEHPPLND